MILIVCGVLLPPSSFSEGPISRSFGKIGLGLNINQLKSKVAFEELKEETVQGILGKGQRIYYIPTVSARPGIEGVYGLFFEDTLYQIIIQYNARYSGDVSWKEFSEGMTQRYGKPVRKGNNHIPKSQDFFGLAGFASKVILVQGFHKIEESLVWEDSETSLGVFQGRIAQREERRFHAPFPREPDEGPKTETNYIVIYSDKKVFEGIPEEKTSPQQEKAEEDPFQL